MANYAHLHGFSHTNCSERITSKWNRWLEEPSLNVELVVLSSLSVQSPSLCGEQLLRGMDYIAAYRMKAQGLSRCVKEVQTYLCNHIRA